VLRESIAQAGNPDGYRRLLRGLSAAQYKSASFASFEPDHAQVILRHDIDLSLELALRMAILEVEEQWISTYFVLLSTQFYNAASRKGRSALSEILSLGHEVGLHFDPAAYPNLTSLRDLEMAAALECSRLEEIILRPVTVTTVHRPAAVNPGFLGMSGLFAERRHAYEPCFFSEPAYISDSAGDWAYGHPLDHACISQRTGMQLLTHPYLWMQTCGGTQWDKIDAAIRVNERATRAELPNNFRDFKAGNRT
jgi:hypothetical protein